MSVSSQNKLLKVGALRTWWNIMLFARQFEMTVPVSATQVASALRDNQHGINKHYGWKKPIVIVEPVDRDHIYQFDIRIKDTNDSGNSYTSVRSIGRIIYSEGYEQSVIHGIVRLSPSMLFGYVLGVIVLFLISFGGALIYSTADNLDPTLIYMLIAMFLFGIVVIALGFLGYNQQSKHLIDVIHKVVNNNSNG